MFLRVVRTILPPGILIAICLLALTTPTLHVFAASAERPSPAGGCAALGVSQDWDAGWGEPPLTAQRCGTIKSAAGSDSVHSTLASQEWGTTIPALLKMQK